MQFQKVRIKSGSILEALGCLENAPWGEAESGWIAPNHPRVKFHAEMRTKNSSNFHGIVQKILKKYSNSAKSGTDR